MGYLGNIAEAAATIFEGLTITASHIFRRPITVQYPDRIPSPMNEMLPPRYRGFLNVDMGICTGCTLCMQACPIGCIEIGITKKPDDGPSPPALSPEGRGSGEGSGVATTQRMISKFNIDIGKCMFCGLCTEPCPTGAIHFTRGFERATPDLGELVFKFVEEPVVPYKKSGS